MHSHSNLSSSQSFRDKYDSIASQNLHRPQTQNGDRIASRNLELYIRRSLVSESQDSQSERLLPSGANKTSTGQRQAADFSDNSWDLAYISAQKKTEVQNGILRVDGMISVLVDDWVDVWNIETPATCLHRRDSHSDPPENCHLTVRILTFFPKKLPKFSF